MKPRSLLTFALCAGLLAACSGNAVQESLESGGFRWVRMDCERLPDMNESRFGHVLLELDGEFTAIGGHSDGFVITRSAEYFKNGQWHSLELFYPHDDAFCALLPDGRVLVGGGYEKDFGIGQTWGVEVYDPATHQFAHLPILDQKRTHSNALALADGRVVVSGNWYAEDWTEIYDGEKFSFAAATSEQRTSPYILDTAPDSVMIFGFIDTYDKSPLTGKVDRLDGTTFEVPLLQEWRCFPVPVGDLRKYFIGDVAAEDYRWLLSASNAAGQRAFIQVEGERFSLVEWPAQLPDEGPFGPVHWEPDLRLDLASETVWIPSRDPGRQGRQYLACLPYGALLRGEPADWTLYYSDVIEGLPMSPEALMLSGGRCLLAGGNDGNYYEAVATAMVLHTQGRPKAVSSYLLGLIAGALVAIALVLVGWTFARRRRHATPEPEPQPASAPDLLSRITALMEDRQFFRRKDLRIGDVASELGTNSTYISACLNGQQGVSFPVFVARYRVEYAQSLMLREPGKRLSEVAEESGFADDASFFRTFKQITGVTPSEWKEGKI